MKQSILVFLTIILCAATVGCGGNSAAKTDNATSSVQSEDISETEDKEIESSSSDQKPETQDTQESAVETEDKEDESSSSDQKSETQDTQESAVEPIEKDASIGTKEPKNGFDDSTNRDILFNGCSIAIPEYFGENKSKNDSSLLYYAETGQGTSMLSVEMAKYNKSEEEYKKEEDAIIMQVLTNISKGMKVDLEKSDIKNRHYVGSLEVNGETTDLEFEIKPLYLGDKVFILNFAQSVNSEFDYFSDFAKIVNSVKQFEEESSSSNIDDNNDEDIDPDFKKSMDDYEEFFNEYVEFMKKYKENPSDLKLLGEMTSMLQKETEMMDDFNNINQDELTPEELSYYLEVHSRILKKLSEAY